MSHYPAVFHFIRGGRFGVSFPDFPGCVSAGDSFEEALRNAAEALAFHVDGMREDGEPLPAPLGDELSTYPGSAILREPNTLMASVPLLPAPGKTVRIQVTIDSRLLSRIDQVTKNRSAFLSEAAAERLAGS